jgi:predicted flavoprotein YhiN
MIQMGTKRIIVIGGSAAGPKAASKARRMDENAEITIFQKAKRSPIKLSQN